MLMLAILADSTSTETSPLIALIAVSLLTIGHAVLALIAYRISMLHCDRQNWSRPQRSSFGAALDLFLRVVALGAFALTLMLFDWPLSALPLEPDSLWAGVFLPLLGLVPFVLYNLACWLPAHAFHRQSTPAPLGLGRFLLERMRYRFFVLAFIVPILPIMTISLDQLPWLTSPWVMQIMAWGGLVVAVWLFPGLLRFLWGCRPLPEGAVLDRLRTLEAQTGVRFSGVYIWNIGNGTILNAAAVGLFPPFRYLFLSRGLLDRLSADEIDGVICHEMGHVRHRHLLLYLILTMGATHAAQLGAQMLPLTTVEAAILLMAAFVLYFRFGFAFVSRRIERQADLYALETLGDPEPLCAALERISMLSGGVRWVPSWHHMSIAERVAFLRASHRHPQLATAHHQRLGQLVIAGVAAAVLMIAAATLSEMNRLGEQFVPAEEEEPGDARRRHWLRVSELLPADPIGPLALAELELSHGNPEASLKAAHEALSRADSAAVKQRAEALIARAGEAKALDNADDSQDK